jgi:DNA-directed RNA polymerase, mitochondrial
MHFNFIKQSNRRFLEELDNRWHELPNVVNAVNIMQKTEWVINKPIFDILKHCLDNSFPIGKLPINPKSIPLPPKPFDIATNEDALKRWKREAHKVHTQRADGKSKFIQFKKILEVAELFLNYQGMFYPYQLDFRGRIYPKSALMSPQGADYSRSLIKFRFGKKMEDAFDSFAIAGAGLYGECDKEELSVRLDWVKENSERIISSANLPLKENWWQLADKPFCFLAWCFEYRDYALADFSPDFITTLPIQSDCSNSGLQHYSAMMRDEVGGKATNLVPSNKPEDVYKSVAEKVTFKLNEIAKSGISPNEKFTANENIELANKWLECGIDRKLCKKPVMCLPYSLTQYSCRQYIQDHVEKELLENHKQHGFGKDLFRATHWLTKIVWEAINEVILGAKEIMNFLKKVSRLVANENLPVTWTTPLGLPVFMACYKSKSKRVKTQMGDSIVKLSITSETSDIDTRKVNQSVCPNFIHSLDASCLQLAVVKAYALGVDNFSLIHDSFGTLAPDSKNMAKALREAFCEIYEKDVLANWAIEMKQMLSVKNQKKFPQIPAKGNLDLSKIKQSTFFCI